MRILLLLGLLLTGTLTSFAQTVSLTREEAAVLRLLNEARSDPARFADVYIAPRVGESREARECFQEMRRTAARIPLKLAGPLVQSSRDHAADLARTGRMGHGGSDGSNLSDRVNRRGIWEGSIAENLYFGPLDPLDIVVELLVDKGVPGRGHRRNILNATLGYVGVAVRRHPAYGYVCVMDFAASIRPHAR